MAVRISHTEQTALSKANALHFLDETQKDTAATQADELSLLADHLTAKAIHISTNMWPGKRIGKDLRKQATRSMIHGVEIRVLPETHFLKGETGLFASNAFDQFSIVGEYCGVVMRPGTNGGEYVAELERNMILPRTTMSLDAQKYGNECRTINHFDNIAAEANVTMQVCYVDALPRIMIVCKKDIAVGEELLLNYGKGYVDSFFGPQKVKADTIPVDWKEMAGDYEDM
jgi:hypothetical protein